MKKIDQKKNKSNASIAKNSYFVVLENAGKRTQGRSGQMMERLDGVWKSFGGFGCP